MSETTNHWKLGLFVIGSLTVALGAVAFIGARQFEQERFTVHMFFNETVDGLSKGSEVRFRGIPVGNVKAIQAAPDKVHVEVVAEIRVKTLERLGLREPGMEPDIQQARERNLRAQIERNPLTGMAMINTDFFDPVQYPRPTYPFEIPEHTLDTIPSTIKGLIADLTRAMGGIPEAIEEIRSLVAQIERVLTQMELGSVSGDARSLIRTADKALKDLDIPRLSSETVVSQEELRRVLRQIEDLVTVVRRDDGAVMRAIRTWDKLGQTYEKLGRDVDRELARARLDETSEALRRVLSTADQAGAEVALLSSDVRRDLATVLRTVDAIRRLAELLERDPGALIHGKTPSRSPRKEGK